MSGPGLLGGWHLGHRAEALVAGGRRAGLVGHDGVAVCGRHIGPRGRGAQAQLLCFDGARAQRVQALWRGPAWQRAAASGPDCIPTSAGLIRRYACALKLGRKALARSLLEHWHIHRACCCPAGQQAFPSFSCGTAHNASITWEMAWGCEGALTCQPGRRGPAGH